MMKTIKNRIPAKSFLKWAGGKGQLLERFISYYPTELKSGKIQNYYEPFTGGGAVYFHVAQNFPIKTAFLYDINEELILAYRVVQKDAEKLIEALTSINNRYTELNEKKRIEFYYQTRDEFNGSFSKIDFNNYSDNWIWRAAQIIFLNKTCFNGLFRFNSKGEFNVPAGRYKNPKILDEQNLLKTSELLQIAKIERADFLKIEKDILPRSFVYFDPPYRPLNATSNFTAYSKYKFEDKEQIQLAELFKRLNKRGIKLMLSNSDPKNNDPQDNFFDQLYHNFYIDRIPATRMINSDASKRNAINEIVVTNYRTKDF